MILGKTVARFVARCSGKGDGLIVGTLLKGCEGVFEPGTVYEAVKCGLTGDIIMKKVGKSCIRGLNEGAGLPFHNDNPKYSNLHWGVDVSNIMAQPEFFMTGEEYESYCKENREYYDNH